MRRAPRLGLWVVLLALLALAPLGAREVPFASEQVVDEADLLPPEVEQRLIQRFRSVKERTGAELAVLTIPSLEGEDVAAYSFRVAETWGVGGERNDNGLLLLVARDDRRMRFEVGYGLEAEIPDIIAGRIINEVIAPRFREGDFAGGIEQGMDAAAGFITGEGRLPEAEDQEGVPCVTVLIVLFFLFFFVLPMLRNFGAISGGGHRRGRRGPSVIILPGGFGGGGGGGFGGGGGGGFGGFGGGSFGGGGASGSW